MRKGAESLLLQKRDGSYTIGSPSAAVEARERLDIVQQELDSLLLEFEITSRQEDVQRLTAALNEYVLSHHQDKADPFETDTWRAVPVRSATTFWNADKLKKLVPKTMFLRLVDYVPSSQKIQQAVAAGKIKSEQIAGALESKPKSPYIKWTKKSDPNAGNDEADELRSRLNADE